MLIVEQDGAGATGNTVGLEVGFKGRLRCRLCRQFKVDLGVRLRQFPIVLDISQTLGIMHDLLHGGV